MLKLVTQGVVSYKRSDMLTYYHHVCHISRSKGKSPCFLHSKSGTVFQFCFIFSDSRVNSVINKCPVYTKQENLWFIKDGPLQAGVNL